MSQKEKRGNIFGRLSIWVFVSGIVGLLAVLYTNYQSGGSITALATNPPQALLYSALLTIFVWVFNLTFNSIIQVDRSNDSKKLRKEIEDLKAAIMKKKDDEPATQGGTP